MKQPENKKELQSFLGLCQYLTKFTPELASLSEPLRFLTRKKMLSLNGHSNTPEHSNASNKHSQRSKN